MNTHTIYKDITKKSAKLSADLSTLHITLPLGISDAEEDRFVEFARQELAIKLACRNESAKLMSLALYLDRKYLDGRHQTKLVKPYFSIKYVSNQRKSRWGSCTKRDRYAASIRLSHSLIHAPQYVINNVIIHELAHMDQMNHSTSFRILANVSSYCIKSDAWLREHMLGWSDEEFNLEEVLKDG